MKACTNCKVIKPANWFSKHPKARDGRASWCRICTKKSSALWKRPYMMYKKDTCDRCGFIPEDRCQLDVDHIDENHNNNKLKNLQTLCANCYRLKTITYYNSIRKYA